MSELCTADVSIGLQRPVDPCRMTSHNFAPGGMMNGFTKANLALAPISGEPLHNQ
jgi:hypothetical protein